jgi:hypothetical protein
VKITIPRVRDAIMLMLGTGGMVNELFVRPTPRELALYTSMALLLGPAIILTGWQAWAARGQAPATPSPAPTPVSGSPPPSEPP